MKVSIRTYIHRTTECKVYNRYVGEHDLLWETKLLSRNYKMPSSRCYTKVKISCDPFLPNSKGCCYVYLVLYLFFFSNKMKRSTKNNWLQLQVTQYESYIKTVNKHSQAVNPRGWIGIKVHLQNDITWVRDQLWQMRLIWLVILWIKINYQDKTEKSKGTLMVCFQCN